MMDSSTSMLGHVELRLRLVYESEDSVSVGTDLPGWRLVGLLPEDVTDPFATDPSAPDMSPPPSTQRGHRFVTEPIALTLDRDEAEGYYLNLTSPQPSLFALIRLPDVAAATAAVAGATTAGPAFTILCALTLASVVIGPFAAAAALRH